MTDSGRQGRVPVGDRNAGSSDADLADLEREADFARSSDDSGDETRPVGGGLHAARAALAGLAQFGRAAARRSADFLVPPLCLSCRTPLADHGSLCVACWSQILFIRAPLCDRLGIPLPFDTGGRMLSAAALAHPPAYDRARAVAAYDGTMRTMIHGLKYADRQDGLALLSRWLAVAAADLVADCDLIVPVPLARSRLWWRRFNQSALLAMALGQLTGRPADPLILMRIRRTRSQVGLTHDQRRRNVQGAFKIADGQQFRIKGRRILLVDDVITTGATVEACVRTLRQAGASGVDVAALARVVDANIPLA